MRHMTASGMLMLLGKLLSKHLPKDVIDVYTAWVSMES
jgi:hypothetical protein